jgi:preprotein translocase subunit SecD
MKTRVTYLLSILILVSCGQVSLVNENKEKVKTIVEGQTPDYLKTGWYYLTEKVNGTERTLNGTEEVYFVDPNPIVTIENFMDLELYQGKYGDFGLSIRLDDMGKEQWRIATGKSIGEKLALMIDNELFFTPIVNSQIDVGVTALNRGDLTEEELKMIKTKIELEKK